MHQAALAPVLAEAYRRAALAGRDMFAFAGFMELVKTAVGTETDLYLQWERLDDRIGEALWTGADPEPFLLVRTVFWEMLGDQLAAAILRPGAAVADDWQRWRAAFSEASFHWRYEALLALCQTPALQARFAEKLEPFERFLPLFRDRRWVEIQAVFQDLATDENLPIEQRGYHYYVSGQIDLYFHYEYARAKNRFETAETMLSGKPLAVHGLIEYFLKGPETERNLDRALELADATVRLYPDHVASMLQKGDVQLEKGQLAEAEATYRAASRKRPGNLLCYTRLIELYSKPDYFEKKQTEIEMLLNTAIQLEPDASFRTRSDVAAIFQNQGEAYLPKAENMFREAVEYYPEGIMAWLNLGYFYMDIAKAPDKAAAVFQQVVVQAPEAREGYLALARLREMQEYWEEAIEHYRKVQAIIPSWERFMLVNTGRCLRLLGRPEEAETDLLRAWTQDMYDDSGVLNELYELADYLYKHPENPRPDAAAQFLQQALDIRTVSATNAAGLANRQGHAFFYVGRYAEALPYYQRAATLVPTEAVYYSNQFDCWEKLYRQSLDETHFEAAQEALSHAAQAAAQDSSIPKKRRQLARLRFNPHLAELPPLYQIHIEVGQPLLSEITQDFQSLLPGITELTDALRSRLHEKFAINLPGLRYRDISDGNGAYQFRLYETPVLFSHLPVSDAHPPTMAAVLERLEVFLISHGLDLFVNYWDVDLEVPFLPNAELVHFTRTVMALLTEQAPLPPLPELHRLYRSLDGARLPVADVVENLRLSDMLRPHLPGLQGNFRYLLLEEKTARKLAACLVGQGNARALALPPNYIRGFFGAVLHRLEEHAGQQIALVTQQAALRPFLRSVLAGLPELPVLKSSELPAEAESRFVAPLTFDEQDEAVFLQAYQNRVTEFSIDSPAPLN